MAYAKKDPKSKTMKPFKKPVKSNPNARMMKPFKKKGKR